jgi:hypothetical protein
MALCSSGSTLGFLGFGGLDGFFFGVAAWLGFVVAAFLAAAFAVPAGLDAAAFFFEGVFAFFATFFFDDARVALDVAFFAAPRDVGRFFAFFLGDLGMAQT